MLKSGRVAIRYGTYGQWTTITYQLLNAVRTGPLQISNEYMYIKISVQNIIANALFNKPRRWLCSPVHVTLSSRNPTVTPEIHNATPYDSIPASPYHLQPHAPFIYFYTTQRKPFIISHSSSADFNSLFYHQRIQNHLNWLFP